jgi:hypothetical protein
MSVESGLAGTAPYARKHLVDLERPYSELVYEAIQAALNRTLDQIVQALITSAYSPVPKDTGFLRSQLQVRIHPGQGGVNLILSWENVPYAQHLLAKAGIVNVRHAEDPMAENPWMEPSMQMVFPYVLSALQQELTARGIEFTQSW